MRETKLMEVTKTMEEEVEDGKEIVTTTEDISEEDFKIMVEIVEEVDGDEEGVAKDINKTTEVEGVEEETKIMVRSTAVSA